MKITLADPPVTAKQYAAALWSCWLDSLNSIFRAGQLLLEAKERVPHGEWLDVVDGSPFSIATADKLMAIARHPLISNSSIRRILPPTWTTLYELSRLPVPTLDQAISDGLITPDLKEHQVRRLLGDGGPAPNYEMWPCGNCGASKLRRCESRPSSLGESSSEKPRLFDCAGCGKTSVTFERYGGLFDKQSLPKASRVPVEGASVDGERPEAAHTGTD